MRERGLPAARRLLRLPPVHERTRCPVVRRPQHPAAAADGGDCPSPCPKPLTPAPNPCLCPSLLRRRSSPARKSPGRRLTAAPPGQTSVWQGASGEGQRTARPPSPELRVGERIGWSARGRVVGGEHRIPAEPSAELARRPAPGSQPLPW